MTKQEQNVASGPRPELGAGAPEAPFASHAALARDRALLERWLMAKVAPRPTGGHDGCNAVEISSEMLDAGVACLEDLSEASSVYLVKEVYRAMEGARLRQIFSGRSAYRDS